MHDIGRIATLATVQSTRNLRTVCGIYDTWKHCASYRYFSSVGNENTTVTQKNIFGAENKEQVLIRLRKTKPFFARPDREHKKGRDAAVLVPLCHIDGEPALLFMIRSLHLKNHRGEISFPGGMQDDGDRNLIHTALRETFEEIGLQQEQVDVWGTLPSLPSKGSGMVTPVLGYCSNVRLENLKLNHSEVEEVFSRTILSLCDPANQRQTQWRYPGTKGYTMPVFLGENHRIWGLTAVILHQVLKILVPELYKFQLQHKT